MAHTATEIAGCISQFQESSAELKKQLVKIRAAFQTLPAEAITKAGISQAEFDTTVNKLKIFIIEESEKLKRYKDIDGTDKPSNTEKSVAINITDPKTAEEINAEYMKRVWYPSSWDDFITKPYSVNLGIMPFEKQPNQCRIHPLSLFSQLWVSFYTVYLAIYAIVLPLSLGFPDYASALVPISVILLIMIGADTYIEANSGVFHDQELQMDPKVTYSKMVKSGAFLFNFVTAFPYVFVIDAATTAGTDARMALRLICLLNGAAVIKVYTMERVSLMMEKIQQLIRKYEVNGALVTAIKIVSGMAFYWHWFSSTISFFTIVDVLPFPAQSTSDRYIHHLFDSASIMLTAAWGVDGPELAYDRLAKVGNMIISAFILALFTANVTTFMIRLDSSGRQFSEKCEEISQYISYKGLGQDLQERIMRYYHFKYLQGKYFDESRILSELNSPLRVSITVRECRQLILQVPFFKDADHSFITQIVTILQINHFLQGDHIIDQGSTGDQMFFISSGSVEVFVNEKSVTTLTAGQFFGEISLLFGNMKRSATIKALTDCVLYSLSEKDLDLVLEINPAMAETMRKTAEERLTSNQVSINIKTAGPGVGLPFVDRSFLPKLKRPVLAEASVTSVSQEVLDQKVVQAVSKARRSSFITPFIDPALLEKNVILDDAVPSPAISAHRRKSHSPAVLGGAFSGVEDAQPAIEGSSEHRKSHTPNVIKEEAEEINDPKNDVLDEVESMEIRNALETARKRPSAANFISLQYLDKSLVQNEGTTEEVIQVADPVTEAPVNVFLRRKSNALEMMAQVSRRGSSMQEIEEENSQHFPIPAGNPTAGDVKIIIQEGGQSTQALPPMESNSKGGDLVQAKDTAMSMDSITGDPKPRKAAPKETMGSDDELDTKKTVKRKVPGAESPEKAAIAVPAADMSSLPWNIRMAKYWAKYQPSLTYAPFIPSCLPARVWVSIHEIVFFIIAVILPIPFGFASLSYMLPGISIVALIFTVLDGFFKLQTGYLVHAELEMDPKKLFWIYMKKSFAFDFLTGFPWVFIIDAATVGQPQTRLVARLFCLVHGFPLVKIFLSPRPSWISEYLTDTIRKYDLNTAGVKTLQILFGMMFYWHWHTCSANFILLTGAVPNVFPQYGEYDLYILHFWSSATEMMNAGCGAVPPQVALDRWLKILNMICNISIFSLFVGNISSFMIGLDSSGRQFNEQLEQVSQYITYKGLGGELKKKILDYYQLKYPAGKYFDEQRILSELNHPLRLAIYMRECRALIIQVPFFKGADNGFISQVVMILKPAHFLEGDLVIEKGTAGDLMFFIASGSLEVIVNGSVAATLSPGQFFGEIALLFGHTKRTASIRAKTACRLYSLSRTDLNFILEVYPDMAEKMQKVAEERILTNAK